MTFVIEGGAARATYASGVTASLQAAGVIPDAIYGTSAGAAIGAWFATGQAHVGVTTWDHIADRRILSYRRGLTGAPPIDFRHLYSQMYPHHFGMDVKKLATSPYPVFATVTDADTAQTEHLDIRAARDPMVLLHATSAIPLISESPVTLDGRRFVDGGVTDPVPLAKAIDDGCKDIVLLTNRPGGERQRESPLAVHLVRRRWPALANAVARRHEIYNETVRLAETPPSGVRVRIVRPAKALGVGRLTRDVAKLRAAIEVGRRDGHALARTLHSGVEGPRDR